MSTILFRLPKAKEGSIFSHSAAAIRLSIVRAILFIYFSLCRYWFYDLFLIGFYFNRQRGNNNSYESSTSAAQEKPSNKQTLNLSPSKSEPLSPLPDMSLEQNLVGEFTSILELPVT